MNIVKSLVNGYLMQDEILLGYRFLNKRLVLVKSGIKQKRLSFQTAA